MPNYRCAGRSLFALIYGLVLVPAAWGQSGRSFVTLEIDATAIDHEAWYPLVAVGRTRDLGRRLSVGGLGELGGGYGFMVGRLGPLAQFNVSQNETARTFATASYLFGSEAGWRVGGGIELLPPTRRVGLRLTTQRQISGDSSGWYFGIGAVFK
jgi:hypothetical protein